VSAAKKLITVDFLRHGEPVGGELLRGRIDHPLSDLGWSQMSKAAALSAQNKTTALTPNWTHLISSPLLRCRAFAEHLASATGLDLQVNSQWQEIDYGEWDGMPLLEWRKQAAPQFKEFREDLSKLVPPNGEPYLSFRDRVLMAWQEISTLEDGSHVLVVTHGGVLRVVLPTVLGMPLNRSNPLHIPFASLSRVALSVSSEAVSDTQQQPEPRLGASLLFHNAAGYGLP
jgi:alpha-ribazole phosphatase